MIYYTREGNSIELNKGKYINCGTQGKIFMVGNKEDTCFKEYSENILDDWYYDLGNKFNQEMFDYFKNNFADSNLCSLYDLYYKDDVVVGYTMKYYKETLDNILYLPTDYILDNYSLIYDLVNKLTSDCIRIVDTHCDNVINTDDKMIIIDYDKYYYDNGIDKDTLDYINKSALIYTFKGIFMKSLRNMGIDVDNNIEIKNMVNRLFTLNTSPLVLKCKLRGKKRLIDYI